MGIAVSISQQLKDAIEQSGHSHRKLDALSGVPQSRISEFVNLGRKINIGYVDAICEVLGLELRPKKSTKST